MMNSSPPTTICSSELETDVSDITITPDGCIRCFGLSRQLLALLCESGLADERLQKHWVAVNEPASSIPPSGESVDVLVPEVKSQ